MKKKIIGILAIIALVLPTAAIAHERQVFEINGKQYQFIVGSLGEPLVVDDKSGVDLRIATLPGEKPVSGLQESLKVELIAADKKKELSFDAVYGTPGAYKAVFFPTVATSLSYRVFGDIDGTPINLTFSCTPSGHESATEDTARVNVSDGVIRTLKTGAFGCPEAKADMGFPEQSSDLRSLVPKQSSNAFAATALALAALAFALAVKKRKS